MNKQPKKLSGKKVYFKNFAVPEKILNATKMLNALLFILLTLIFACSSPTTKETIKFNIPEGYLDEVKEIPAFWVTTVDEVAAFLKNNVKKGKLEVIGTSAGGRPIHAVFYGQPRQGMGTTTFSGSIGCRKIAAYRGPDHAKTVYMGMAAVHGFELEGIAGMVNLISVLETGKDLRGKEWPEITDAASKIERLILIPLTNPDGRKRVPVRMLVHRDTSYIVTEYLNTGGKPDGTLIGWPQVKEFIPLDFKTTRFPGGYPNDAGVNIMHDDFMGKVQPETQALLDLTARERPDIIINMHTGAPTRDYFIRMHRPFGEEALRKAFEGLYQAVHTGLALSGLQGTRDPAVEADLSRVPNGVYNLDTALDLHCGALSVVIESPSHGFSGWNRAGEVVFQSPEMILDAQLVAHLGAIKYLGESGGRAKWTR